MCIWKPKVDIRQLPQSLPTLVLRQNISLNLELTDWLAGQQALRIALSLCFYDSRIISACYQSWIFTWVLRIPTQVFSCAQQALDWLRHLLDPGRHVSKHKGTPCFIGLAVLSSTKGQESKKPRFPKVKASGFPQKASTTMHRLLLQPIEQVSVGPPQLFCKH